MFNSINTKPCCDKLSVYGINAGVESLLGRYPENPPSESLLKAEKLRIEFQRNDSIIRNDTAINETIVKSWFTAKVTFRKFIEPR